ncbi:hypothetical protein FDP41_008939 [Naegleria fowleri]|uniref:Sulfhydryl oxidase n=1 Tax=Naegleria fowleri TaxID=5763 RepID=M1H0Q9_NAEFO|nr:uncharacterized protein FDP41_008939 [Naegleria fowleri]AGE43973.1 hypothetical protein [Naegleria fowleri]KAF0972690.1 hypothetical protein FDP41_008939 [Naegleria fowleri]CAG4718482.1 unnamed protein product [Naegleria fowleri]
MSFVGSSSSNSESSENSHKKLQDNLGASTWAFMHTVAAQYPKKPSPIQQHHIKQLFVRIAEFYPCRWCAKDFAESIKKHPIRAESREALSIWLCERHNEVNEKIGKPIVPDCKTAWKRWIVEDDEEEENTEQKVETEHKKPDFVSNDFDWLDNVQNQNDNGGDIDFDTPSMDDLMKDCKFCENTMGKERYDKLKSLLNKRP